MIESYSGKRAFFIGNGINRINNESGVSWIDLLERIAGRFDISSDFKNELKPLNLAFEEMLFGKIGSNSLESKLRNLKEEVARILSSDGTNLINQDVHSGFMNSGVEEIITTNYDYNLEIAIVPEFLNLKIQYAVNNSESKHSLFRGYNINDVNVRHIHGELKHNINTSNSLKHYSEESIMIGFEHYSDYFKKIQDNVKGVTVKINGIKTQKDNILFRIRNEQTGSSWIDLFFTHQLIFTGFSFDFSENHLWWLLLQRQQFMKENFRHEVKINNQIIYCYPEFGVVPNISQSNFEASYKIRFEEKKNIARNEMLISFGVIPEAVQCNSYEEFYLSVIEKYCN